MDATESRNIRNRWLAAAENAFKKAGFTEFSFVEIDNEYCPPPCSMCAAQPWLLVHTGLGTFKVGWRKRVISLDWKGTVTKSSGEELFPNENVTRWETGIHAWGYEKLGEYLSVLRRLLPNSRAGV